MKYKFSEIKRFEDWGYNRRNGIVGKYGCQVFDKNGLYVTCLICDTLEEIKEQIKIMNKEKEFFKTCFNTAAVITNIENILKEKE